MKIVIIGAGPAGVTVAETVRQYDDSAEIIMISGEPFPPYSPPAMLEYFATGREDHFWKGKDFPQRLKIHYRTGIELTHIFPKDNTIRFSTDEIVSYDHLVLASGARLYTGLEGEDKPGIYNFKSLLAANELLDRVRAGQARSALIIGAGFIGVEIGLFLADLGLKVTQLVRSRVMRSMLDLETSQRVLDIMRERGIHVLQGDDADTTAFTGENRAEGVQTKSGNVLRTDVIVAAMGIKPNIDYTRGSSLQTDWGIPVDDHMRTNFPDISAAGDVAETKDRITGRKGIHGNFPNAVAQGRVLAYNLLGWDTCYEGADNMNSLKHLGVSLIAVGQMEGEEMRVKENGNLRKIYLRDNRIIGFRLYGDISSAGIYRSLMNRQVDISTFKHRLLKPGFGMGHMEVLTPYKFMR